MPKILDISNCSLGHIKYKKKIGCIKNTDLAIFHILKKHAPCKRCNHYTEVTTFELMFDIHSYPGKDVELVVECVKYLYDFAHEKTERIVKKDFVFYHEEKHDITPKQFLLLKLHHIKDCAISLLHLDFQLDQCYKHLKLQDYDREIFEHYLYIFIIEMFKLVETIELLKENNGGHKRTND